MFIYAPDSVDPILIPQPFDLIPPAQAFERNQMQDELDKLLGELPGEEFENVLSKAPLDRLDDTALAQLFGADIAPPAGGGARGPAQPGAIVPPETFDAVQRNVQPGMNELSRYGYNKVNSDPYGADMRNELRTLVRNAPIQGL